jgi:predicted enzyme related to lactoylglutathione lyase
MHHAINWFEIPVTDIERAAKFYGAIFDTQLAVSNGNGYSMAIFPHDGGVGGAVGGGLVAGEGYTPSTTGPLIYLNADPDLSVVLARVHGAGGQVIMPKTDIGENGFYALILDSEGNRVGIHSIS